ncbi:hypothetical protein PENSPDRAFT_751976 [Peniophora sp. CONT]|nr:hypothetical protein PENSPDRAFT_751976 [Peniophora sp. CONT]
MTTMNARTRPAPLILTPPDSPTAPAKGFRGASPPPSSPSSPSSLEFEVKDSRRMSRLPPLRRPHRAQDDAFVRRHVLGASSPTNVDEDEYTGAVPDSYAPKRKGFRLSRLPPDTPASTLWRSDQSVHPSASPASKHSFAPRPQLPTPSPPAPSPPRTSRLTGPRAPRHSRSSSLSTPGATISALFPSTAPPSGASASGVLTASPFPYTPSPLPSTATIPPPAYTRGRTTSLNDVSSTSLPGSEVSSPPSAFTQGAYIRKRTISLGNAGLTINTDIKPAGRMLPIPRRSSATATVPAPAPTAAIRTTTAPPPSLSRATSVTSSGSHTRSNSSISSARIPSSRSSTGLPKPAGARTPGSSRPPSLAPQPRPSVEALRPEPTRSVSKPSPMAQAPIRRESYRPLPPAPGRRASAPDATHGADASHVPMHALDVPMSVTASPAPSSATYVETPSLAQHTSPSSARSSRDKPVLEASISRFKKRDTAADSDSEGDSPDAYDYRALKRGARDSGLHLLRPQELALFGDGGSDDEWEELPGQEKVVKPARASTLFALGAHTVPPTTPAHHHLFTPTSPDQGITSPGSQRYAAMPDTPASSLIPPASAPLSPPSADSMRWASPAHWTGALSSGSEYSQPSTALLSPPASSSASVPLSAPPSAMAFALATNSGPVESPLANVERAFSRALADANEDAPKSSISASRSGPSASSTKPAVRKPLSPKQSSVTPSKSTAFFHTAPSSPKPASPSSVSTPPKKRRTKKTSADATGFNFVRGPDGRIMRVPAPASTSPVAADTALVEEPTPSSSRTLPSVPAALKPSAPAGAVVSSDSRSETHGTPPTTPRLGRLRSKRSFKTPSPAPSLREISAAPSAFTGLESTVAESNESSDPEAALQTLNGSAQGIDAPAQESAARREEVIVPPTRRESLAYTPSRSSSRTAYRESTLAPSRRSSVAGPRAPVRISVGAAQRKRLSRRMSARKSVISTSTAVTPIASGSQTPRVAEPSAGESRMQDDTDNDTLHVRGARSSAGSSAPTLSLSIPPSPSISAPSSTAPAQPAQNANVPNTPSLDDPGALPSPLNTATMPSPGRVAEWTRARYRDSLVPPPGEPPASPNTVLRRMREGNAGRSEAPPRPSASSSTIALVSSADRPNVTEATVIPHPPHEGSGVRGEGQDSQVRRVFTELDTALLLLDADPELELPEDEPLPAYMVTAAVDSGERSLDRGPRRPHGAIRPPPSYASLNIRRPKPPRAAGGGLRALFTRNNTSRATVASGDESGSESESGRRRGLRRFFGGGSTGDLRMMESREPRRSTSSSLSMTPSYTVTDTDAASSSHGSNISSASAAIVANARRPTHSSSLSADMANRDPVRPMSGLRAGSLDVRSSSAMELSRSESRQSEQTTSVNMEDTTAACPFPSSTPTVGHPLLRDGRILVYPEGHECPLCQNTGFAHDDPNHACEICWNQHSRPFTSVLARFFRRGVAKKDRARLQKPLRAPTSAPGNMQSFPANGQAGSSTGAGTQSDLSHSHRHQ